MQFPRALVIARGNLNPQAFKRVCRRTYFFFFFCGVFFPAAPGEEGARPKKKTQKAFSDKWNKKLQFFSKDSRPLFFFVDKVKGNKFKLNQGVVAGWVIEKNTVRAIRLLLPVLTDTDRKILLAGNLINYQAKNRKPS